MTLEDYKSMTRPQTKVVVDELLGFLKLEEEGRLEHTKALMKQIAQIQVIRL